MLPYRIHIICQKPELCSLVKKSLVNSGYNVTCTENENLFEKNYLNRGEKIDCLIVDKFLNSGISEKVKKKFSDIITIMLPSLETENQNNYNDVRNISEPLKISELTQAINNALLKKNS